MQSSVYIFSIEIGLGILVNSLFMIVFLATPSLRKTASNRFLINLLASDILTAISAAIALSVHTSKNSQVDIAEKAIFMYIFTTTLLSYLLSLLIVTADRFIAIILPYRYETMSRKKNVRLILVLTWLFIILVLVAGILLATSDSQKTLRIATAGLDYFLIVVALTGIVFLVVTNFIIYREVRRQLHVISSISVYDNDEKAAKRQENNLRKKELRAAYLCIAIVAVFVVTWSIFVMGLIAKIQRGRDDKHGKQFFFICQIIVLAALTINPFLYIPFNCELRRKMKIPFRRLKMLFCKEKQERMGTSTSQTNSVQSSL